MTRFAKRFTGLSGTASLMEDLGDALNQHPELIFMGGGNPAHIDDVESCISQHCQSLLNDPLRFHKLIGEYQPPQGDPEFREVLAEYLSKYIVLNDSEVALAADNIAISNGGQSAFFSLFNMLAGQDDDSSLNRNNKLTQRRILLPMVPDYLGYADAGLDEDMFVTLRPLIEKQGDNFFKYKVDFDRLTIDDSIAAICLSRPANPSGNIVGDDEICLLQEKCKQHDIPLIIDLAYGKPFPNITYVDHHLYWDENTILVMSLSKLGMPGVRTGLVVAAKETITRFSRATASLSLAPSNLGPALCKSLLNSNVLSSLVETTIQPFYYKKMQQAVAYFIEISSHLPIKIHQPEGAFFLWIWLQDLPISSQDLYQQLKQKGVLVLSGHHFFRALGDDDWDHRQQCLRLSYCQPWNKIKEGIDIIITELTQLYKL